MKYKYSGILPCSSKIEFLAEFIGIKNRLIYSLSSRFGFPVFEISANNLSKYLVVILLFVWSVRVADNDLQASDGRDIEALNCKPITNL